MWRGAYLRQHANYCSSFFIEVSEYFPDDPGIFDTGNHLYRTTAFAADHDLFIENPLQALRPGDGCPLLEGILIS